ncbi:Dihydroneopterin aldolase [Jeotgalicoccus aerolatus]|uniref:7,8-dihydroneopterin aldolase n=1 Tax=Jeotgalicoccus aerolatus TaxID=709510 RepID=A0A1G9B3X4_9STAP|nr:dihydroneopterin aldolase [Jeotgalicoccus aerolatus]MBP1952003.1 dihydroneopterin aldolase [Jeotgalicoccus aerolatus]NMA80445.1 dihydroneopterin aldolase [Jeotgalicoccus aerolatus]CAD2071316.1 Dihydroneopterin aldolase [Jeotgalicoccus aerolatus]SDK34276.1 dihydroneopterin aldolase [Jeotgalicoccus aerolatus]GGE05130.1 7,8-dihydroneopterin aldolase [Jeotgalicoccus aerolatus]
MDKIYINGIKTYGYHGAIQEERVLGQYFITDIVLYIDLTAASETDDLNETVHYGEVYNLAEEIIKGEPVSLIERLAGKINAELFDRYDKIVEIETTITKPNPPIDGNYESVAITLHGKRETSWQ